MKNKNLIKGIALGILISAVGPVYSYYNSYTDVCELEVNDLEQIIEDVVEDVVEGCDFKKDGGYPYCF